MTTGRDTETFLARDKRVRRLRQKPGLAEDVAAAREQMREADRAHAMGARCDPASGGPHLATPTSE